MKRKPMINIEKGHSGEVKLKATVDIPKLELEKGDISVTQKFPEGSMLIPLETIAIIEDQIDNVQIELKERSTYANGATSMVVKITVKNT